MLDDNLIKVTRNLLNPFKVYGRSASEAFSDGQVEIVASIVFRIAPRVAALAPTGYGKSEAVAVGTILRAVPKKEKFVVASVKYGTADIIMGYIIDHLFDHPFYVKQLELEKGLSLDRLRRDRKKSEFNFREGGGIRIVSLHGKEDDPTRALGEHAPNIILDESPLLSAGKYLQVLKMLEGTGKYEDTFLLELGNAINRNHFHNNVMRNDKYLKIVISLEQAIKEGRLDRVSVEEKRGLPFFEQFYENKFPDEQQMDSKGYRYIISQKELDAAQVDEVGEDEDQKLGVDVAGGGDYNAFVIRGNKFAFIDRENKSNDTMTNVTETTTIMEEQGIPAENVFIDDIGIGRGVSDRLIELENEINPISVGGSPLEPDKYMNIKAECYWLLRMWIKEGGKLKKDKRWDELLEIKYKINSDKVLKIEPKEDLKKRTGKSPDFAEALMLTFAESLPVDMDIL